MDAGEIMAKVKRVLGLVGRRIGAAHEARHCDPLLDTGFDEMSSRELSVELEPQIAAALATIREESGDGRFDAFSDDELLLATLKFGSIYYGNATSCFNSEDLADIIGIGSPERLAALVENWIVSRKSQLNQLMEISVSHGRYVFEPLPAKLNALFMGETPEAIGEA